MKKTAPSNLTAVASNPAKPHAAEEKLRAIAAQEERRAQAARTPAQMPAHAALVPAALVPAAFVPTEAAQDPKAAWDLKGVRDNPLNSGSAFRGILGCASAQAENCASVQTMPGICAFSPQHCSGSQVIQEDCGALLAWYEEYAEETEQSQNQQAEGFAEWQQSRSGRTLHPQGGGILQGPASPFARPLPLRAGKRTPLGRAHQHWDTPEGRLLVQVRLGEAVLLPKMRARNAGERGAVNARIAEALGLAAAVEAGMLTRFVVGWQATGRWPRRPVAVQLFWPGGKVQGDRLRGKYGPLLVHLQEEARVHFNQVHFNQAQVHRS